VHLPFGRGCTYFSNALTFWMDLPSGQQPLFIWLLSAVMSKTPMDLSSDPNGCTCPLDPPLNVPTFGRTYFWTYLPLDVPASRCTCFKITSVLPPALFDTLFKLLHRLLPVSSELAYRRLQSLRIDAVDLPSLVRCKSEIHSNLGVNGLHDV
jgi:hypothetical protein